MYRHITTLTEFVVAQEKKNPHATGSFTLLLTHIENAVKIIASHVKRSGLVDILGKTGATNAYDEEVMKLDDFSDKLLFDMLKDSGQVGYVASEEKEEPVCVDKKGKYNVFFDPLDGSSNIDVNINIGTIFSIYQNKGDVLQEGRKQVAAGYVLYGSSVMFVYSSGQGVHGFTLDPTIGSFLHSHENIRVPETKNYYSINDGNVELFEDSMQRYLTSIKKEEKPYQSRYVGSMVADVHRTLLKGGIFMNPANKKRPTGKLRLMYEVNPMSYLIEQAGGSAVSSQGKSPLDIEPQNLTQRVPIVLGSKKEIEKYLTFL
ncbi:fructose-bisphosphatase [Candidatus Roizmanbacteria bacterium RIFOXYB2_FULL_38_10]|uniref:Fructose-1,6-bisphosphatase class 1 n=1 Tax=Candidatus Roizmanbacteria bacterium RIFOXYD1_FULL_38_12 TaxID=1802093 RepID=A0A1F7L1U7_9BACT|nr:MAG: fructose-bisphosphatase [Candidatus Roizmanbacteria bacterium RIFOXYA2_FULL_38_14]OGK64095.1 MAG: fructose-bisphosphatase [Candidatus Roizmanbacteria bacterium RIFOXYA1_FULL_37_12]OGK65941.1 MAG: fructose-bisphosphatase [Candidatus Roizmanbacteria bacterium RIFOXYB1_FULL_40_23]OGK67337.1 MAG: fructose-bisphosphatase [Candidatus Roizmanbacteria bacterium RIFOXYB2_FULL_38_10]OGK70346.1 MAG: fructose-bisphosphatase [Candidatus Roizmanbacteria bacterium RIFOXYC1_FULL_38_14]OGK72504.1 MAG: 